MLLLHFEQTINNKRKNEEQFYTLVVGCIAADNIGNGTSKQNSC